MNALLASKNWAIALVIALMLSVSHYLDGYLGPDDIATEATIAADLSDSETLASVQLARGVQP